MFREGAFDQFIDAEHLSDAQIAKCSRELTVDIAIDLTGFTQDGRTNIFALLWRHQFKSIFLWDIQAHLAPPTWIT